MSNIKVNNLSLEVKKKLILFLKVDKINVLLIDDDSKNLDNIEKRIANDKLDITKAIGGQLGLEKIRKGEQFDIVMIDDAMPKLSTVDTLKKLKQIENTWI